MSNDDEHFDTLDKEFKVTHEFKTERDRIDFEANAGIIDKIEARIWIDGEVYGVSMPIRSVTEIEQIAELMRRGVLATYEENKRR